MKRFFLLSLVLSFLAASSMPLGAASDKPKQGGTLNMGLRRDIQLMNPLVGTRSTEQHIRHLMFETLLDFDLTGTIQPNLATQWTVSNDGKLITFKLREDVKFHNGKQMTAQDVKFSIEYTKNPKNGAFGFRGLALVDRVETEGKYTLNVYLKKPSAPFLAAMTSIQTFSVIPKESLPEGMRQPVKFPPGTGPFKFVEWKPKRRLVLERNGEYWGHKAFIEKIVMRPIRNNTTRVTALRAGDVDMIERVPHEWVKQIEKGKIKGIRLVESNTANFRRLLFNVASPPFDNKNLRKAVAMAINKREILHGGFFGMGEPVDQKYPKGNKWYIEGLPGLSYDLQKATKLVKESGYTGKPIKMLVEQSDQRQAEAVTLQSQVKKIGLILEFHVMDRGAYNSMRRKGNFALVFIGGSYRPDPSATYTRHFACEKDLKKRRSNTSGYCDKEMDRIFNKMETEPDPGKRKALLKEVLTKLAEDLPEIPIGFVPRHFGLSEHVKGFTTDDNASFRWFRGGLNYTWIDR